jgi:hypothetical protein
LLLDPLLAERRGFEPPDRFYPVNRLAGGCLQPLGHLSKHTGGGSRIRTHGAFAQRFSRPPPSTTRPSLRVAGQQVGASLEWRRYTPGLPLSDISRGAPYHRLGGPCNLRRRPVNPLALLWITGPRQARPACYASVTSRPHFPSDAYPLACWLGGASSKQLRQRICSTPRSTTTHSTALPPVVALDTRDASTQTRAGLARRSTWLN